MKRLLTEIERSTATNGLYAAAELFKAHALELVEIDPNLADQFMRQFSDSLVLADLIDNCESIEIAALEVMPPSALAPAE